MLPYAQTRVGGPKYQVNKYCKLFENITHWTDSKSYFYKALHFHNNPWHSDTHMFL